MHSVNGKTLRALDAAAVANWAAPYRAMSLDLGTGDGRFVRHLAQTYPAHAAIGLDTCQSNLRTASRTAPANALFVVANALNVPSELHGLASRVTINFPWGSLLHGLLAGDDGLLAGLRAVGRGGASLEVNLNAGALDEAGWPLDDGARQVAAVLKRSDFAVRPPRAMERDDLRGYPTTWAKKLAFGRDPRAIQISASLP
ncbi:MAG: class I SAM-dependent methyltransferase [Thermomicrobiales bacterium]